jgi:transposase-like protein
MQNQRNLSKEERINFWKDHLGKLEQSGMSLREFSKQEGIGFSTLSHWRKRLKSSSEGKRRRETITIPVLSHELSRPVIRISIDGADFGFSEEVKPEWAAAFVASIRQKGEVKC